MKRTLFILLIIFFTTSLSAQNKTITDAKGNIHLQGQVTKKGFQSAPFSTWFEAQHDDYLINDRVVRKLKDSIGQYKIKVFFGSWCGDSKREVPRFYKILEQAKYPTEQLEVVALNRSSESYKQSPDGEEKGLNIHRVPTFIFYKDGKEVNRIVEHPKETLERDMLHIISQKRYNANYRGVTYLNQLFKEKPIENLATDQNEIAITLTDYVDGRWELNTYGYVLLSANEIEKSTLVFSINALIYPNKYQVYDSLGEAYLKAENYADAAKNFYKVLSLNPENKNAKSMLTQIENRIN